MKEFNKFIGLDEHKSTIAISIAPEDGGEVRYFGKIKNTKEAFCYEAGGCGYEVYRHLRKIGHDCMVVAPGADPVLHRFRAA